MSWHSLKTRITADENQERGLPRMKTRKRRQLIIFLLLISLFSIFVYVRRGLFVQQAKKLLEQNLAKSLPGELSIGRVKAGLFSGLILKDLQLRFPQSGLTPLAQLGRQFNLNIKVAQARVDYRKLTSGSPELILDGGEVSFGGGPALLKDLQGKLLLSKNGLDFQKIRAELTDNPENVLQLNAQFGEDSAFLTANLEHVKFGYFDILTNLDLTLEKKLDLQDQAAKLCGRVKTYGTVLNNQPFLELNATFEVKETQLRILKCSLGEEYNLRGIVDLTAPFDFKADLSLNLQRAEPNKLIAQFTPPNFSGMLNGLIKITGSLNSPRVEGYLEVEQGHIGDLAFVSADINIKGRYPRILLVDSRICRESDYFIMEGEIDFSNLEKEDFLDIRLKSDKGMFWQGWDITRMRENQVRMSKNIADDIRVTFDTYAQEESLAPGIEDNHGNELGLEYRIFGDKLLKLRLRKEEEILGLERKIRF